MTGWIKIHRKIIDHWIWADSKRFKWWLDILLLTNHSDKNDDWWKFSLIKAWFISYIRIEII